MASSRLMCENAANQQQGDEYGQAHAPRFRENDFAGGISRGVDDIISVLTGDAEEWKARAAQRPDETPAEGVLVAWGVTLEGRKVLLGLQLGSRRATRTGSTLAATCSPAARARRH